MGVQQNQESVQVNHHPLPHEGLDIPVHKSPLVEFVQRMHNRKRQGKYERALLGSPGRLSVDLLQEFKITQRAGIGEILRNVDGMQQHCRGSGQPRQKPTPAKLPDRSSHDGIEQAPSLLEHVWGFLQGLLQIRLVLLRHLGPGGIPIVVLCVIRRMHLQSMDSFHDPGIATFVRALHGFGAVGPVGPFLHIIQVNPLVPLLFAQDLHVVPHGRLREELQVLQNLLLGLGLVDDTQLPHHELCGRRVDHQREERAASDQQHNPGTLLSMNPVLAGVIVHHDRESQSDSSSQSAPPDDDAVTQRDARARKLEHRVYDQQHESTPDHHEDVEQQGPGVVLCFNVRARIVVARRMHGDQLAGNGPRKHEQQGVSVELHCVPDLLHSTRTVEQRPARLCNPDPRVEHTKHTRDLQHLLAGKENQVPSSNRQRDLDNPMGLFQPVGDVRQPVQTQVTEDEPDGNSA
mmetsp:Transcript_123811/g.283912  ORF Transcript_123811/g.283912 Transcript_123811/m.283912 type:complete len:461 (-) Transcript_123811:991-2373(-)